jgi:hypothetical protein
MRERDPYAERLASVDGLDGEFVAESEVTGILRLGHVGQREQREQRENDSTRSHSELSPEADFEKGTAAGRLGEWDSSESAIRLVVWLEHNLAQGQHDASFQALIQKD